VPDVRAGVILLAVAVAASGCSGASAPETTADPDRAAAEEYAFTARRALEGTRFEGTSDAEVAGWVLGVCDALEGAPDPGAAVDDALEGLEAGSGADARILAVVLAEGAIAVCAEAVDAAALRAWEAADAETRFVEAVAGAVPVTERDYPPEALLEAGRGACLVLDGGAGVEDALLAVLGSLFGVSGPLEEVSPDDVGDREGLVAGSVLAAAASILCPVHRGAVEEYAESLARQDG
jgi:hypothetical protein